jgi:hypothetical protein
VSVIRIETRGLRETLTALLATPKQVETAERRAVNKTARWASATAARRIAEANAIPLKAITRGRIGKRGRVRVRLARRGGISASVWLGTLPVPGAYAGRLTQTRRGARAGRHFFERAFLATMPTGHRGVYRRVGPASLPIREQTVKLDLAGRIVAQVERELPARLSSLLRQELHFELNVRGRR